MNHSVLVYILRILHFVTGKKMVEIFQILFISFNVIKYYETWLKDSVFSLFQKIIVIVYDIYFF
jgi:hypothetical protein